MTDYPTPPPPNDLQSGTLVSSDARGIGTISDDPTELEPFVDPGYHSDDRNWVRYRPSWGSFTRIVIVAVVIIAALFWARTRVYAWVDAQITPAGLPGAPVEYTIGDGASLNDIAGELHSAGVISNATVFRYWLRCEGELTLIGFLGCDSVTQVEAGEYLLYKNMSFDAVLAVLGQGPAPEVYELITIPEGLRWSATAERLLQENPIFDPAELEAAYVSLFEQAQYLPTDAEYPSMEGMLFPATYDIPEDFLSDEYGFLLRMSDEFDRRYTDLLNVYGISEEFEDLGLDAYDVIIVASLVEEESLIESERPKIARVIYNRMHAGERLDIDATACYAANKPCSELTSADIDNPSPWNTRAVRGLPPTPISAPSEASLIAALAPAEGNWLFYARTDEGGVAGAHTFTATIDEHIEQVQICRSLGYC